MSKSSKENGPIPMQPDEVPPLSENELALMQTYLEYFNSSDTPENGSYTPKIDFEKLIAFYIDYESEILGGESGEIMVAIGSETHASDVMKINFRDYVMSRIQQEQNTAYKNKEIELFPTITVVDEYTIGRDTAGRSYIMLTQEQAEVLAEFFRVNVFGPESEHMALLKIQVGDKERTFPVCVQNRPIINAVYKPMITTALDRFLKKNGVEGTITILDMLPSTEIPELNADDFLPRYSKYQSVRLESGLSLSKKRTKKRVSFDGEYEIDDEDYKEARDTKSKKPTLKIEDFFPPTSSPASTDSENPEQ